MRKNTWKRTAAGLGILVMALSSFAGCSDNSKDTSVKSPQTAVEAAENTEAAETAPKTEKLSQAADIVKVIDTADIFSNRDMKQTADTTNARALAVSDGKTIDITDEGIYVISGSAENCTIRVEAPKEAKVQLVLDGVDIENEDFPAIYAVSADKVFITTTDSENTLSVTGSFTADGDTNTDAVIFSKDDLTLNGTGSLTVYSAYGNGITSKDDLKITGGTYSVTSAKHAFEANDSIAICGGDFTVDSDKDGFHAKNNKDNTLGYIYISGGSFEISSVSDGIQGTTYVQIDGGTFNITSAEGIEGTYVQINGGDITISASDDGINAAAKSTACDVVIEFNGGNTTITMGAGDTDAVDANGSIYVNGGTINITARMSSFDYDVSAEFNGGTIIINGEEVSEIPQSMMGGHGGRGGFGGHGGFGGAPDGERVPPEGFDKFPDGEHMPPEGFGHGGFNIQ